jgi:aspartate racemase
VDFMSKIIAHTPASRDQDHIRMLVNHEPQIPDRTEHLLNGGPDPTDALFTACKQLESNGVTVIAIPCNTAHAFLDRIQPCLTIPVIRIPDETVSHIRRQYPGMSKIGLMATSGTVHSRIYQDALAAGQYSAILPDTDHQHLLMETIYGDNGIKAGHTTGVCLRQFRQVAKHLTSRGAELLILGCTELPLLLTGVGEDGVETVPMIDPTDILARRCVALRDEADG